MDYQLFLGVYIYSTYLSLPSELRKCNCENLLLQLYVHIRDLRIYRQKSRYFPFAVNVVRGLSLTGQRVQTCVLTTNISCVIVLEYEWIETVCL